MRSIYRPREEDIMRDRNAIATVLLLCAGAAAPAQQATTTLQGTTKIIRVARPDEPIVVNGKILRVSELMSEVSFVGSSVEPHLRTQEKQNREESKPSEPSPRQDLACHGGGRVRLQIPHALELSQLLQILSPNPCGSYDSDHPIVVVDDRGSGDTRRDRHLYPKVIVWRLDWLTLQRRPN
jgi:hypothetical protein